MSVKKVEINEVIEKDVNTDNGVMRYFTYSNKEWICVDFLIKNDIQKSDIVGVDDKFKLTVVDSIGMETFYAIEINAAISICNDKLAEVLRGIFMKTIASKEMMIFHGNNVEIFELNGVVYFNPKDIAKCLDIKDINSTLRSFKDNQLKKLNNSDMHSTHIRKLNNAGETFLLESGVYKLIFKSRKESAEKFQDWVTDEVLPTIRKIKSSIETVSCISNINGLVQMRDGFCYTTSNKISEIFNKEHYNIIRDIDKYMVSTSKTGDSDISTVKIEDSKDDLQDSHSFMKLHTIETTYIDSRGKIQRSYELDEFAFSFLALGFTGTRAEKFKIQFINQFFKMRQELLNRTKALAIENVLPQKSKLRQYVYLIKNEGTNNIKIGVGQNPEQRLKQLQTGSDTDLVLLYKSMVCSNAFEIESYMHKEFEEYHVRGEWFAIDDYIIIDELNKCEFILNTSFDELSILNKFKA